MLPDYTNKRFGRLLVLKCVGLDSRKNRSYECLCDCGNKKLVAATLLKGGLIQSCGCLLHEKRQENLAKAVVAATRHGMSGTPSYRSWAAMIARCYDIGNSKFPHWGGRGVEVCSYLRADPNNLVSLIGERPSSKHTIDRLNNDGSYTCGKCAQCLKMEWPMNVGWRTAKEQANNRSNNVWVEINGVRKTRAQWAEELGIPYKKAVFQLKEFEMRKQLVEFRPPDGAVPEGTGANEEFDLVCTFRVKDSGTVCLVKMGDSEMPGYNDKGSSSKPDYGDMTGNMMESQDAT